MTTTTTGLHKTDYKIYTNLTNDIYMTYTNVTLNVNGLSDEKKRTNIYQFLKNKTADFTLSQETHSTKENENRWQNEWKGLSIWHSGKKLKSSGVAILIKKNLNITILQTY